MEVKELAESLTEEKILDYYMKMRNVEAEEMITVTPRQLEGLIRFETEILSKPGNYAPFFFKSYHWVLRIDVCLRIEMKIF